MTRVRLSLTIEQAEKLGHAAGNSIDHPDVMAALFPERRDREIAYRASDALYRALGRAQRPEGQA